MGRLLSLMDHKVRFIKHLFKMNRIIQIIIDIIGVEAQTLTVWRQADKYQIPRLVYVNKMDRLDSSFDMCLKSLQTKFETEFLPLQVPVRG